MSHLVFRWQSPYVNTLHPRNDFVCMFSMHLHVFHWTCGFPVWCQFGENNTDEEAIRGHFCWHTVGRKLPGTSNLPSVLRTAGHVEWSTVALGPVIDRSITIPVGDRMSILVMTVGYAVPRRSVLHVAKLAHLRVDSFVLVKFGTFRYVFTMFKQMLSTLSTVSHINRLKHTKRPISRMFNSNWVVLL